MSLCYAYLIMNGKKTFADVPVLLKDRVRQDLINLDLEELAQE